MSRIIQGWQTADKRGKKSNRIPPFAPSKNEVGLYRKYVLFVKNDPNLPKRALILGATPELRDIAIENGLESVAVDVSKQMMEKFSALMEKSGNILDKRIISDWLNIDFPENYFGIIMGDASFNNLATKEDNESLAYICCRVLNKGGFLILRQVVYQSDYRGYMDIQKLANDFHNGKISWADFFMEMRFNIFKDKIYDAKLCQYDAGKAFDLIKTLADIGQLTADEYTRIDTFRNNLKNSVYLDMDMVTMLESNGFKLQESFNDKPDLFFKYLYMLAFQKA